MSEKTTAAFVMLGDRRLRERVAAPLPGYDPAFETCPCESPLEHAVGGCWPGWPEVEARPELALDRGERVELCSCEESAELRRELAAQRTIAAGFETRINRALALASAPARPRLMGDGGPSVLSRVVGALRGEE